MSLILNIDTAIDKAYVSIAKDGIVLEEMVHDNQKDHAAFLQPAIASIVAKVGIRLQDLAAIAVADGPGSYTGLRVGMASAKGLCYALGKPLITVGSLQILTRRAIDQVSQNTDFASYIFCPMIDARRMEVYTAVYSAEEKILEEPTAMILNEHSFVKTLLINPVCFFGNGADKWKIICESKNAIFLKIDNNTMAMSRLTAQKFQNSEFSDIVYAEPFYLKEFFTNAMI